MEKLATVTLTFYEGGKVVFTGMEPNRFKTQEKFVKAINILVGFCRKVLEEPAYTIPGFKFLQVKRIVGGSGKLFGGFRGVFIEP